MVSIDARPRTSIDIDQSKSIDRYSRASIDDAYRVNRVLQCLEDSNSRGMPEINVARLNALRPKPKPSEYPPEPVRTPSDDGEDPVEEDMVPSGRILRRRKEKVVKYL
ncbi:hypothetical protein F2Q69_00041729 [Brassica cretica]|uniref:Uncharacterized protein n=1 Tax=Brassica cretica TaxID=69181 RepID=A0A8S9NKT3_BRACR|nr:hypothetical protein F2Q69_00041729 [Brassica cretica]